MNKIGLNISQILLLLLLLVGEAGAINLCFSNVPQVPEALIVCWNVCESKYHKQDPQTAKAKHRCIILENISKWKRHFPYT